MSRPTRLMAAVLVLASSVARGDEAERKAVAYLATEVPRWARENHCYSCHNNGDAARALFRARALGITVEPAAVADTIRWLTRPEGWDRNGGEGPMSDKRLARVEFALALASAVEDGASADRDALRRAADRMAEDQAGDGSWPIDDSGVGSPATYGRRLATALTARVLEGADAARHAERIARARAWVRSGRIASTPDAAAVLLADPGRGRGGLSDPCRRAVDLLRIWQSKSGGWGPHADSPAEPFDTALALLALSRHRDEPGVPSILARGRAALVAMQGGDGAWTETTRPSGGESYAQRLSTSGWATLALFASRP